MVGVVFKFALKISFSKPQKILNSRNERVIEFGVRSVCVCEIMINARTLPAFDLAVLVVIIMAARRQC